MIITVMFTTAIQRVGTSIGDKRSALPIHLWKRNIIKWAFQFFYC